MSIDRPNILLITTDQHNAEIMGCAGNHVVQTPHLDRLAEDGMLFSAAYTPHPYCTPARTTIFTGLYGHRHKVMYNMNLREDRMDPPEWTGLGADVLAFPEILAQHGYRTSFFGKLHTKQMEDKALGLEFMRLAEGKGQFVDYGTAPDDYRQYLLDRGYPPDIWRTWELPAYGRLGYVTSPLPVEDYIDTWTASEALRYLDEVDEPFFSWVSFSGPHTPWDPPRPYDTMYTPNEIPLPVRREGELEEKHPRWVARLARTVPAIPPRSTDPSVEGGIDRAYERLSEEETRAMLAAYYGQISLIDAQIGRLLDDLDGRGVRDHTVVLFTSDHGDYLGNNWAFYKYGAPYESLARVPFIVSWPGVLASDQRSDALVSLTDVAPTFLELAGVSAVPDMDGRSLTPLLLGEQVRWRDAVFVDAGQLRAIMTPTWKYIRWQDGFEESYNRKEDPHDLYNLARRPQSRSVCGELAARLAEFGEV
ncbi:MAG: sulfatase family protein [Anaerolineae bacterium]